MGSEHRIFYFRCGKRGTEDGTDAGGRTWALIYLTILFLLKGEPRSERKRWRYYGQWVKNR
jgi:hypothetical protein